MLRAKREAALRKVRQPGPIRKPADDGHLVPVVSGSCGILTMVVVAPMMMVAAMVVVAPPVMVMTPMLNLAG